MNYIAINQESVYADIVNKVCPSIESINKFKRYNSFNDAVGEIWNNQTDVVFLDFKLSNIEILDFFKLFSSPPKVILVSLNSNNKLDFFSVNINNKQLYPISEGNIGNFICNTDKTLHPVKTTAISKEFIDEPVENNFMFIKVGSSTVKVDYNDIKYIEGLKDYIKIYVNGGKSLITKCTIKHIEQKLPANNFIRIHKSYIVSLEKIEKIEFNHTFIDQMKIPIGAQFRENFLTIVDSFRL